MRSARWASVLVLGSLALAVAAGALLLPSCAKRTTAPQPSPYHSLSGRVRLVGHLVDAGGVVYATSIIDDADSVDVVLTHGPAVVAHALTVKGVYTFSSLLPGDYVARADVVGAVLDSTRRMTIASTDVFSEDTLLYASAGDIFPVPNPVVASCELYFALADSETVNIRILDLAGNLERPLWFGNLGAGLRSVTWNGDGLTGAPSTKPMVWATLKGRVSARAQLLFR